MKYLFAVFGMDLRHMDEDEVRCEDVWGTVVEAHYMTPYAAIESMFYHRRASMVHFQQTHLVSIEISGQKTYLARGWSDRPHMEYRAIAHLIGPETRQTEVLAHELPAWWKDPLNKDYE